MQLEGHGIMVDYYSLGVLFYELLVGLPPFFDPNKMQMFNKIMHSEPKFPSYISKQAQSLIKGLVEKNPSKRIGSSFGFQEIKDHEYFRDFNWGTIVKREVN
jgi:serine/threonine protein kinase